MNPVTILIGYFKWHYSTAIPSFIRLWVDFLWFVQHFFSITTLLKTLLSPWRRLDISVDKDIVGNIIVSLIMRIIGAVARTVIIIIGTIFLTLMFVGGIAFFLFWLVAPFAIIAIFVLGLAFARYSIFV